MPHRTIRNVKLVLSFESDDGESSCVTQCDGDTFDDRFVEIAMAQFRTVIRRFQDEHVARVKAAKAAAHRAKALP